MPEIGDVKRGKGIGYKTSANYIWAACIGCGIERWSQLVRGHPQNQRCHKCSGKRLSMSKHPAWKGGKITDYFGYAQIKLSPDDFFYPMANSNSYVREHRLIMARHLGRNLHRWEIVHHKNHIRDDNRIENLQLVSDLGHKQILFLERRIEFLEQRATLLEAENARLGAQLGEGISKKISG